MKTKFVNYHLQDLEPGDIVKLPGKPIPFMYQGTDRQNKLVFMSRDASGMTYKGAIKTMKNNDSLKVVFLRFAPELLSDLSSVQKVAPVNRNEPLTHKSLMPIGKYKGRTMETVPAGYLLYLYNNHFLKPGNVLDYVLNNLQLLMKETNNFKTENQ